MRRRWRCGDDNNDDGDDGNDRDRVNFFLVCNLFGLYDCPFR